VISPEELLLAKLHFGYFYLSKERELLLLLFRYEQTNSCGVRAGNNL
jgi:hypothetical protein